MILTSCSPIDFQYDKYVLSNTVVRVELIYYHQPEVQSISDLWGFAHRHHLDFDFELVEHIKILEEAFHEKLLSELSSFTIQNAIVQNNSPTGLAILLHYMDGYFDVFSSLYVGRFNSEGKFIKYLGDGLWEIPFQELIESHFNYKFEK